MMSSSSSSHVNIPLEGLALPLIMTPTFCTPSVLYRFVLAVSQSPLLLCLSLFPPLSFCVFLSLSLYLSLPPPSLSLCVSLFLSSPPPLSLSPQILVLYECVDVVDVEEIVRYVKALQREDGSFVGDKWGECGLGRRYIPSQQVRMRGREMSFYLHVFYVVFTFSSYLWI